MLATSFAMVRLRNLFAVVMLSGIFSLLGALLWVVLDAPDVAFTEAAVGAGISTLLFLATLVLTSSEEKGHGRLAIGPILIVSVTGGLLIYGTLDMPAYGDPNAPIHLHVAPRYIEKSGEEVGPPNIVTSVLASYRGYDTMGETTVIFTAAAGVLMLIGRGRGRRRRGPENKRGPWLAMDDEEPLPTKVARQSKETTESEA